MKYRLKAFAIRALRDLGRFTAPEAAASLSFATGRAVRAQTARRIIADLVRSGHVVPGAGRGEYAFRDGGALPRRLTRAPARARNVATSHTARVMVIASDGAPHKVEDVAKALDASPGSIQSAVVALVGQDFLRRDGRGVFRLNTR